MSLTIWRRCDVPKRLVSRRKPQILAVPDPFYEANAGGLTALLKAWRKPTPTPAATLVKFMTLSATMYITATIGPVLRSSIDA